VTYEEWERQVPEVIKADQVWQFYSVPTLKKGTDVVLARIAITSFAFRLALLVKRGAGTTAVVICSHRLC
jgi:hypothetical protein